MEPMSSEDVLRAKQNALKQQYDILTEKVSHMRAELAALAGGSRWFELKQDIETVEAELTLIDREIVAIDEELKSGGRLNRHQDKSLHRDPMSSEDVLREKRNELKQKCDLLTRELTYLRTELAAVADGMRRFELEQDIETVKAELTLLNEEIAAIDEELKHGG